MTSLFILQLVCCAITTLQALQLAMASLQTRWKTRRYEVSRWLLCTAMLLFSVHYLLQMIHGLRAQGADVGAAFNILFYTPAAFAITLSIINVESMGRSIRRYCLHSTIAYIFITIVFILGVISCHSFHIGNFLYLMLVLFVASMIYFIFTIRHEIALRKYRLIQDSGSDLIPYVRYAQASLLLLYLTAMLLPITILFNTLLYIVGPLMLLTVVFFVQTFISLGYYITPQDMDWGGQDFMDEEPSTNQEESVAANGSRLNFLSSERVLEIENSLQEWREKGLYKDSNVNIYSLAAKLGCEKDELTQYFNQSVHTNFRTWLSDVRFKEAVRMMKAYPEYSNDNISTECGFSSHTQIYRIFKQKTGMSPNQWRDQLTSSQD